MFRKLRNWLFYRKCKQWKKKDGFLCYVCTATRCFRNHFIETLKYYNDKCTYKDCQNERLEKQAFCEEHKKKKDKAKRKRKK